MHCCSFLSKRNLKDYFPKSNPTLDKQSTEEQILEDCFAGFRMPEHRKGLQALHPTSKSKVTALSAKLKRWVAHQEDQKPRETQLESRHLQCPETSTNHTRRVRKDRYWSEGPAKKDKKTPSAGFERQCSVLGLHANRNHKGRLLLALCYSIEVKRENHFKVFGSVCGCTTPSK